MREFRLRRIKVEPRRTHFVRLRGKWDYNIYGGVAEWFKAPLSKSDRPERVSRVQIFTPPTDPELAEGEVRLGPPSPPVRIHVCRSFSVGRSAPPPFDFPEPYGSGSLAFRPRAQAEWWSTTYSLILINSISRMSRAKLSSFVERAKARGSLLFLKNELHRTLTQLFHCHHR